MGEHRNNPNIRALQLIGATGPTGQNYAWFFGTASDYFMELPSGKIVCEVSTKPSQLGAREDTIYAVSFIDRFKPGESPPVPEYYVTRSAARAAVEASYDETTVSQNLLAGVQ